MLTQSQHSLKKTFCLSVLAHCLALCYSPTVSASIVRGDVDYQYFRDFAENKGVFSLGASNVPIVDKNGNALGVMLNNIPMIDFSSVSRQFGIATLIAPQYITSVQHNETYPAVSFGAEGNIPDAHHFHYFLTNRNDYPDPPTKQFPLAKEDFHVPRLHKLVTEVAPATVSQLGSDPAAYQNGRFSAFVRIGSGRQATEQAKKGRTELSEGYEYLTAGAALNIASNEKYRLHAKGSLFTGDYGPLITYGALGDSGSPLFGYDSKAKRWVLVGVLELWWGEDAKHNRYTIPHQDFIQHTKRKDIAGSIKNAVLDSTFMWEAQGKTSYMKSEKQTLKVDLKNEALTAQDTLAQRPSLAHGKHVHFEGKKGTLVLKNNIDQGAGALYFHTHFVVKPLDQQTYLGGGVFVSKNKTVEWQVANPKGDRLSKLGKGTLLVNGKGVNHGDLSVGDGVVILDQKADKNGAKQAFNQVGITSGRPTLILNSADQTPLDNLYFGYRGGRLDVNGLALRFNYIQNADDGARIVNHHPQKRADLTIKGYAPFSEKDIRWQVPGRGYNTDLAALYEDKDPQTGRVRGYFILTGNNPSQPFPTHQQHNENWQFISQNKAQAIQFVINRNQQARQRATFSGYFGETDPARHNGAMSITYHPTLKQATWLLSGGMKLNGDFNIHDGVVMLSGRPTPHAMNMQTKKEVVLEHDWLNRLFQATSFNVKNHAKLYVGRNVEQVKGNFNAENQAELHLGFKQRDPICQRSDYTGLTHCHQNTLQHRNFMALPKTHIQGNIQLQDQAKLHLGFARLEGTIEGGKSTSVSMTSRARWTLTGDSHIGHLHMMKLPEESSTIYLSRAGERFNTLHINGDLTGNGLFVFRLDLDKATGDNVVVEGDIQGKYAINVFTNRNSTPKTVFFARSEAHAALPSLKERFTLLKAKHQRSQATFDTHLVDLGAYRYTFREEYQNNQFALRLSSPALDAKIAEEERITLEKQQADQDTAQALARAKAEEAKAKSLAQLVDQKTYTSQVTNTALSLLSAHANIAQQVGQNLDRQHLAKYDSPFQVWTNHEVQKTHNSSENYRTYQQTNQLTQIGVDGTFTEQGDIRLGAVLSATQAQSRFDDEITNKTRWLQGSAYLKKVFESGLFAAVDASVAQSHDHLSQHAGLSSIKQGLYAAGLSIGYHKAWGNVEINPMLTARYHHFSDQAYMLNELSVQTQAMSFLSYQAGLKLAKTFDLGTWSLIASATTYYSDASQKQFAVSVDNEMFKQQFGRYLMQEIGLTAKLKKWQLNTNLGLSRGNQIRRQHSANMQLSYHW
ncbi:S6 family peptidase [Pasteurella sp. PK-2025]|uniref:S6 family peptidase n=1 Tax=Pasteurella sp. PK-2025 TaxID=3413133 RepID=UPI003C739D31